MQKRIISKNSGKTAKLKSSPKSKALKSANLTKKLNRITKNSDVKFTSVTPKADGSVELEARVGPKFSPIVNPIEPEEGSILHKIKLAEDSDILSQRLENARMRSVISAINNGKISGRELAGVDVKYRDKLGPTYLDLREKAADKESALKLYKRSEEEYYNTGIYGTSLDLISNFAAAGFYNETNLPDIKDFYDSWVADTDFISTVGKIFRNLFKYSVCYVLSVKGAYEPHADGISSIPGKEPAKRAKASDFEALNRFFASVTGAQLDYKEFSKVWDDSLTEKAATALPVGYTVLDPKYITLTSAGYFNKYTVKMTRQGLNSIKKLSDAIDKGEASAEEKEAFKMLPSKMKAAALANEDYIFDPEEISVIFLRKEDFETYAKPRGARAFDALDMKDELKKADFATVDGVFNYILKITVGDKDNPVTDEAVLKNLAAAFNTPQKAFSVVWNHTLNIEKITAQEVGDILGKKKYEPVEEDITAALGIARTLIDGRINLTGEAAVLSAKALKSEIEAARLEVEKWIYKQYKIIAALTKFSTYPTVRWKTSILNTDSDAVTRASYMQMADRRIASAETVMRELGYDFTTEVDRLEKEFPLIQQGLLLAGSPYQQTTQDAVTPNSGLDGRPKSQPTAPKEPDDPNNKVKTKAPSPGESAKVQDLALELAKLSSDEFNKLIGLILKERRESTETK